MLAGVRRPVPFSDALKLAARFAVADHPGKREALMYRLDRILGTRWPDAIMLVAFPTKGTSKGGKEDTLQG